MILMKTSFYFAVSQKDYRRHFKYYSANLLAYVDFFLPGS